MVQLISFGQLSIFLLLPIILLVVLFLQDYIPLKLMEYYPLIDNHIFIEETNKEYRRKYLDIKESKNNLKNSN